MNKKTFLIYKSSAGSGKTYTLAKNYIKLALKSPFNFKKILAVTFTNKAANEMKERILEMIDEISHDKKEDLISEYTKYYKITPKEIVERATNLQRNLIHNYSYFSITTIDTFFYSIIQSFTRDLKFRGVFNIEMDQELVTNEVVDNFLSSLRKGSDLSNWLTEFSRDKLMREKDFMIFQELRNMLKNLFSEEFKSLSQSIENRSYSKEIKSLRSKVYSIKRDFEARVISKAKDIYSCLKSESYTVDDFSYKDGGIAGYIRKTSKGIISYPGTRVLECVDNSDKWVSKSHKRKSEIVSFINESLIDSIGELVGIFENEFIKYNTAMEIKNYLYVFGILSELQKKVIEYRDENEVILISDISELLYEIIKDDSIPFVFEKVGNTFNNFLIDEFQDTSNYQWKNFRPMISESLASGDQNIIVGDIKQSIYRWRGSDSKIMNDTVKSDIDNNFIETLYLNTNWRSGEHIIKFNNRVFSKIPNLIEDITIRSRLERIYNQDVNQKVSEQMSNQGYVEVIFKNQDEGESMEVVKEFTIDCIKRIQDKGYGAGDIGIIVRDNNEARIIAEMLIKESKNDDRYNYNHVSADALDIKSSPIVSFFISVFTYILNYKDRLALSEIVHFYYRFILKSDDISHYAMSNEDKLSCLPKEFKENLFEISRSPIYDMVEKLIRIFDLNKIKDQTPYLQAFQDSILEYKRNQRGDACSFMEWWKKNSNKKLHLTEQQDSISLITIHKSKGLEFNYVILPFFNWTLDNDTRGNKEKIMWVDLQRFDTNFQFPYPIKYKSKHPKSLFSDYYEKERIKAYEDNINLMYVSFTRPRLGLFVHAKEKVKETKNISDLLFESLQKDLHSNKFIQGNFSSLKDVSIENRVYNLKNYPSFSWKERIRIRKHSDDGIDFDNTRRGKKIHDILMNIKSHHDINNGINIAISKNVILGSEKKYYSGIVSDIINHQKVKEFFNPKLKSYNELEVLNNKGDVFRIDRVVEMEDKSLHIIDYKTGNMKDEHILQVKNYKNILNKIHDKNVIAYLVYIDLNKIIEV